MQVEKERQIGTQGKQNKIKTHETHGLNVKQIKRKLLVNKSVTKGIHLTLKLVTFFFK